MKKNILNLYENFLDDLDKLNQDKKNKEFGDVNSGVYDEHDFILSQDKNPEFFKGLCEFCKKYYPNLMCRNAVTVNPLLTLSKYAATFLLPSFT